MSEIAAEERNDYLLQACQNQKPCRWLMVSNSGTLLNTVLDVSKRLK